MTSESATAKMAAKILGVSERRVRQLAEDGTLTVIESSPLSVSVADCLRVREQRDKRQTASESAQDRPGADLRSIVAEVASGMLRPALEAARSERDAFEAEKGRMVERIERELRDALAEANARATAAEARVSELTARLSESEGFLAAERQRVAELTTALANSKPRRWGRSKS